MRFLLLLFVLSEIFTKKLYINCINPFIFFGHSLHTSCVLCTKRFLLFFFFKRPMITLHFNSTAQCPSPRPSPVPLAAAEAREQRKPRRSQFLLRPGPTFHCGVCVELVLACSMPQFNSFPALQLFSSCRSTVTAQT